MEQVQGSKGVSNAVIFGQSMGREEGFVHAHHSEEKSEICEKSFVKTIKCMVIIT